MGLIDLPDPPDIVGGYLWVVGFDPGVTTGWAVFRLPMARLRVHGFVESVRPEHGSGWAAGEFGGGGLDGDGSEFATVGAMLGLVRETYELVDEEYGDQVMVVTEDFILRRLGMDRSLLSPVRLNAVLEWEFRKRGAMRLWKQAASDAKTTVTDGRLLRWGLYLPGSPHRRDAMRHAILLARKWSTDATFRQLVARMQ